MKKIIALILSVMMVATMCSLSFADDQENVSGNFNPPDASTPIAMHNASFETLGSVISTVGDTTRIAFVCPSWSDNVGCLTVTLWKWDTDYKTTVAATPIAGPTVFEDYEDNSILGFEFETPLAAGVYYAELSDAVDEGGSGVGVWSAEVNYGGQAVLRDGEYVDKLCLRMYVDYVTEPEGARYGELPKFEKPKSDLGSDAVAPCEIYFKMADNDLSMLGVGDQCELWQNDDGTVHVFVPADAFDCKYDLRFANIFEDYEEVSCQEYPYIAMRLKLANIEDNAGNGEAFMYTTTTNGATGGYSTAIRYDWTNPDWQTVVIDPTSNASFKKNALEGDSWFGFRYDVLNAGPANDVELDIDWIAFFANEEAALAFDGNFEAYYPKATKAPTAEPTATPEATATPEPTEAPVATEVPATDAPAATEGSGETTDDTTKEKSNTGLIIGIVAAAVVVAAVVAGILIGKKKKK